MGKKPFACGGRPVHERQTRGGRGTFAPRLPGTAIALGVAVLFQELPMRLHDALSFASRQIDQDHEIQRRIRSEFAEMPELKLTTWQASRLFDVEARRCERVLATLVDIGALRISGASFVRADSGSRSA
jgi:hypothetical protein